MSVRATHQQHITSIGELINSDPMDRRSDIGRKIFDHLDLATAVAFTQVSRGLYDRAKRRWFVNLSSGIIFKYIQQGTSYKDYLKNGGWQDFLIVGAKVAGVTLTVVSFKQAAQHGSRIPPDAPRKTTTVCDEYGSHEITYIDHPEARAQGGWQLTGIVAGTATGYFMLRHSCTALRDSINLESFFTSVEREMISAVKTPLAVTIFSHDFATWRKAKMRDQLSSNPSNWQNHPQLRTMRCPLSGDFILFPVKDQFGHYFDYRSVRARQLDPSVHNPLECPICIIKPNTSLSFLQFDKARFDQVQAIIRNPVAPIPQAF